MFQKIIFLSIFFLFIITSEVKGQSSVNVDSTSMSFVSQVVEVRAGLRSLPYPVAQIKRTAILNNAGLTMEPLLQSVPGIWMQSGAPNTNRISIRGIGNREPFATSKLRVYLGEIPLTNGSGESSIEDIDPFIFRSIEIWKSPTSALWGSGIGGMIQLKPNWSDRSHLQLTSQIGSFGQWNTSAGIALKHGKTEQHQTMLHAQYARQNGYRENNEYKKVATTWMEKTTISDKIQLQTLLHIIRLKAQIPSSLNIDDFNENPRQAAFTWANVMGNEDYLKMIGGVSIKYLIDEKWIYRGTLFLNAFESDEVRPFNVLQEKNVSFGTRQKVVYSIESNHFFTLGMELFREQYDNITFETLDQGMAGQKLNDLETRRNHLNLFFQYQNEVAKNLNLTTGINYTQNSQRQFSLPFNQSAFSPTIGLNYETALTGLSFFTSYSQGFSPINFSDALDSNGAISTDLKPERGWSFEVGARLKNKKANFSADVTCYNMRVRDLFVQRRIGPDQFVGANAGQTNHNGLEFSMQYRPLSFLNITGSYAYADHRFDEFIDGENDFSGNDLTGTAPHMSHWSAQFKVSKNVNLRIQYRYISSVPINDANTVFGDPVHVINSDVSWKFDFNSVTSLRLIFGIQNLTDRSYASMYQINARGFGSNLPRFYYPAPGRNLFFKAIYEIK